MPLRIALTGKNKGPELKYLLPLLSKKIILSAIYFLRGLSNILFIFPPACNVCAF